MQYLSRLGGFLDTAGETTAQSGLHGLTKEVAGGALEAGRGALGTVDLDLGLREGWSELKNQIGGDIKGFVTSGRVSSKDEVTSRSSSKQEESATTADVDEQADAEAGARVPSGTAVDQAASEDAAPGLSAPSLPPGGASRAGSPARPPALAAPPMPDVQMQAAAGPEPEARPPAREVVAEPRQQAPRREPGRLWNAIEAVDLDLGLREGLGEFKSRIGGDIKDFVSSIKQEEPLPGEDAGEHKGARGGSPARGAAREQATSDAAASTRDPTPEVRDEAAPAPQLDLAVGLRPRASRQQHCRLLEEYDREHQIYLGLEVRLAELMRASDEALHRADAQRLQERELEDALVQAETAAAQSFAAAEASQRQARQLEVSREAERARLTSSATAHQARAGSEEVELRREVDALRRSVAEHEESNAALEARLLRYRIAAAADLERAVPLSESGGFWVNVDAPALNFVTLLVQSSCSRRAFAIQLFALYVWVAYMLVWLEKHH